MNRTINDLDVLIEILDNSSKEDFKKIGAQIRISAAECREFAHWSTEKYTRNCISRQGHYELILLCWEPGQATPIHCHGGEECWVYMIEGRLTEERYEGEEIDPEQSICTVLSPGGISYMTDDMGYHTLANDGNQRAMSLHLYMDPIDRCTYYDERQKTFVQAEMEYDTAGCLARAETA